MPLTKQTIDLPFGTTGLDQGADPRRLQAPALAVLENARFDKTGRIAKRYGFAQLSTTNMPASTHTLLSDGRSLAAIGTLSSAYYDAASGAWRNLADGGLPSTGTDGATGSYFPASYTPTSVLETAYEAVGSFRVLAVAIPGGTVSVTVVNAQGGVVLTGSQTGSRCAIEVIGTAFYVITGTNLSTQLRVAYVDTAAMPASFPIPTNIALGAALNSTLAFGSGVDVANNRLYVAYANVAGTMRLVRITGGAVPAFFAEYTTATTNPLLAGTSIHTHWHVTEAKLVLGYTTNAAQTAVVAFNPGAGTFSAHTVLITGTSSDRMLGVVGFNISGTSVMSGMFDGSVGGFTRVQNFFPTTLALSASTDINGITVAAFASGSEVAREKLCQAPYADALVGEVGVINQEPTSNRSSGSLGALQVRATINPGGVAGGDQGRMWSRLRCSVLFWRHTNQSVVAAVGANIQSQSAGAYLSAYTVALPIAQTSPRPWINTDRQLLISGVGVQVCTPGGVDPVCPGALSNCQMSLTTTTGFITAVTGQTLGVRVRLVSVDSAGVLYRGTPTPGLLATAAATNSTHRINFPQPTLVCPFNSSTRLGLQRFFQLYRTLSNGSVYYLADTSSTLVGATYSSAGTSAIKADATVSVSPPLNSAELEPIPPPTMASLAFAAGRVWGVTTDGRQLWFSKIREEGISVEFAEENVIVADVNDTLLAVGALDDKIVVFGRRSIYVTGGEGPDNTGQGAFPTLQQVVGTFGATAGTPVVQMPDGLVFQSAQGLRMLGRDLQIARTAPNSFFGSEVEDEFAGGVTVISACVIPELQEARFVLSSKRMLCYHWEQRAWSVTTFNAAITPGACCAHNGTMALLDTAANQVLVEDTTRFYDRTSDWVTWRAKTCDLPIAGLEAFGRLWQIQLSLNNYTAHGLSISAFFDGATSPSFTRTWTEAEVLALTDPAVSVRVDSGFQKCGRFAIQVSDTAPAVIGTGQSIAIAGIALTMGAKQGTRKLPATSRK